MQVAAETKANSRRFARANQVAVKDGVLGLQSVSAKFNPHYITEMRERFEMLRAPGLSATLTRQEISDIAGKARQTHYGVAKQLN